MGGLASSTILVASGGQWRTFSFTAWLSPQDTSYPVLSSMYSDPFIVDDVTVAPTGYDMNRQTQLLKNPGFEEAPGQLDSLWRQRVYYTGPRYDRLGQRLFWLFGKRPHVFLFEAGGLRTGKAVYTLSAYFKPEASLSGVGGVLTLEARDAGGTVLKSANSSGVSGPAESACIDECAGGGRRSCGWSWRCLLYRRVLCGQRQFGNRNLTENGYKLFRRTGFTRHLINKNQGAFAAQQRRG